jgi:hypothetical protein
LLQLFQSEAGAQGADTPPQTHPPRGGGMNIEPQAKAA